MGKVSSTTLKKWKRLKQNLEKIRRLVKENKRLEIEVTRHFAARQGQKKRSS